MPTSTLTSRGRVSIPKPIREALYLQPGDHVEFILEGEQVVLRRTGAALTELDGMLVRLDQTPGSFNDMNDAIERGMG